MSSNIFIKTAIILYAINIAYSYSDKLNLDVLNNYSEFLNFGDKKLHKITGSRNLENAIFKSKLDVLGEIFKKNVDFFKVSDKLDIVFLVDASSSVGDYNFKSELKFIKKLLSDITVDYNHTRVAVVTFSSPTNTIINIDDISDPSTDHNKCLLLNEQLMNIEYKGGETYTVGALQKAKDIFESSHRNDSKKVIFLITDGYSNGGSPVPLSHELKNSQVSIFTIGIRNGNYKELYNLSSAPGQYYSYLLDSFEEFEGLARRALHVDLSAGDYIPLGFNKPCDKLCETGDCCDQNALCTCGTTTGHYSCVCQPGFYGSGLRNNCQPCPIGMYSDGPNLCLPCPDAHHTTVTPAFGIDSCICKTGFQSDGTGGCKILKCPKINAPEHGYIIKKKECSNVLNSACGIRCEVSYTLVGSSIRLCQANASWSGSDPTCEVKTCTKLPTPKFGSVKCEQTDLGVTYDKSEKNLPVDTVCSFECEKGNLLIGSTQRSCLPIAQWDGLRTICKPIKCQKLPKIKYGRIEPQSCTSGKQEYGKKCKIICNDGFKAAGPTEKICGDHGSWGKKREETVCTDVTPPSLKCPANITTNTVPGTAYGQVFWEEPNITDNSGLEVSVWIKPSIVNVTNYKFAIGETSVTYFAQDVFQNTIKCKFFVEVLDKEPPTIEECIDPPTFLVNSKTGYNITWDEPDIFDNSQNVTVTKSHEFGLFPLGTTVVTYTARDSYGNMNICRVNIIVEESHCTELEIPQNAQSECRDQSNGIKCIITCQEGYAIPLQATSSTTMENSTSFLCEHDDPFWQNQDGMISPECSITIIPESTQEGDIGISLGNTTCNDTQKISEIENNLKTSLSNALCTDQCEIDLKSECEVEKSEEDSNIILTKRRKREETPNLEVVPHKNTRHHKKRKKLNVKFQVRGRYLDDSINRTEIKIDGYNSTMKLKKVRFSCPVGFIPRKSRCVQCPRGTFKNSTTNTCQSCDFGFYNDKLGQIECTACPENHSTRKMHAKSFKECRGMCPPGTHARKKKIRISKHKNMTVERTTLNPYCKSCPIGTYQPEYGKTRCIPCPLSYTTTKVRATSAVECISTAADICKVGTNKCANGICIAINKYEYSCDCFERYFGPYCDKQISPCDSQPCYNGGTCTNLEKDFHCTCSESFTGKYCEVSIEKESLCNLTCQNGGTCLDTGENEFICACPIGFSGERCEIKVSPCKNLICENNGTCTEYGYTFKCICSRGFMGRRCNLLPCDYRPCEGNSICMNLDVENANKNSYKCVCPEGYTGSKCLDKIDYCASLPCQNNGKCRNDETSYTCECSKLYSGSECQYKRDTNYMLRFSRYDINDYVRLRGYEQNLTEITACLWMQTLDNFNYGTLLSYATRYMDNAFTLTDYTGLVFYVNNRYVVTDVLLNDGYWHHICAAWQSSKGNYQIYVDGKLMKNGTDLASNSEIEGHGYLIIGQEQDVMGGRFSQSESFVGNMAYIDIWSKALSEEEILEHFNDCSDSVFGDLYGWPEMQENTNGNIERLNSTFCKKCDDPKPVYNGFINIIENKAFYSCYEGFELSNKQFDKGRRCTKTSKWEGFYEPYCKKIYCGYPGFVKNGFAIGNRYYYGDEISYMCDEGFNMYGNRTIVCEEDGQWFPNKPKCIGVECTLPNISHGEIQILSEEFEGSETSKVEVDTQISITCFDNATLVGETVLSCLDTGFWNYPYPTCQPKKQEPEVKNISKLSCPINLIPPPPENSYIDEDSLHAAENGSTDFVEYKCRSGYKLIGVNTSTCIIDGYWTEPNISCQAIVCPKVPLPKNMVLKHKDLKKDVYTVGDMVSYQCDDGYKMFGNGVIRCTRFGKWSRMMAKCSRISCGKPPVSSNAHIEGDSYLFGDSVTITCQNKLSFNLTCGKDRSWKGALDKNC